MTFETLNLNPALLRAVREKGYTDPTPIQAQAIPPALEGRDILGCAQTGTGKTAAFALPILHRLWKAEHARGPRPVLALVLAPTRELATQIDESFRAYGKHSGLKSTVVFGGVGYDKQRSALKHGVDIVVATPGRLLDLMKEGTVRFDGLRVLVVDEADRMLDMGFLRDVKRVLGALPKKKQTLCFSATMPPEIRKLVDGMLHDPARVAVTPVAATADKVEQAVYMVDKNRKADLLISLLRRPEVERALVFTRTKRGANRLATKLSGSGVPAEAIHGNKSQNARERALASFKSGRGRVLVATDIAARGIDVTGITHVINFELPNEPETYVHRIGRTARANASGVAWSLCGGEERDYLRDIERLIRQKVPVAAGEFAAPARGAHARAESDRSAHARSEPASDRGGHARRPAAPSRGAAGHARTAPAAPRAPVTRSHAGHTSPPPARAVAAASGFGAGVTDEDRAASRADAAHDHGARAPRRDSARDTHGHGARPAHAGPRAPAGREHAARPHAEREHAPSHRSGGSGHHGRPAHHGDADRSGRSEHRPHRGHGHEEHRTSRAPAPHARSSGPARGSGSAPASTGSHGGPRSHGRSGGHGPRGHGGPPARRGR
ncbi:MAG: DEAD/DEAH box helicase [Planctomycetes bacterium]|nr:DEAD/DEAH box helicase [Planctomycetota bacterium]